VEIKRSKLKCHAGKKFFAEKNPRPAARARVALVPTAADGHLLYQVAVRFAGKSGGARACVPHLQRLKQRVCRQTVKFQKIKNEPLFSGDFKNLKNQMRRTIVVFFPSW
jgi:hypothetical protein